MKSKSSVDRGHAAERLAARFLEQQGYRILEFNYLVKTGEIDIVAEENGVLCVVEVRSRKSRDFGDPLETVDWKKRTRLIRATQHLLAVRGWEDRQMRFDVVGIVYQPKLEISLVRDAFDGSGH
ncbi:MAG: YraN family protein [Pseudomonadota bacterium]